MAGLVAVLVLLVVAVVVGVHSGSGGRGDARATGTAAPRSAALLQAQRAAALPPCLPGLATELPDLRLPCLGGGPDVLASAAPGRPTLVNLWGTWCGPCVAEVPELVAFAARAGDRVGVVGVASLDTPASVYAFAKQFGIDYPLVRDDLGDVLHHYGTGVPKTLLVTADGRVAYVQVGAFPTLAALQDAVATHLGVRV